MNKSRRASLDNAKKMLKSVSDIIADVSSEEQSALDNLSELFPGSERCDIMEEAIESLDNASDSINDAIEYVESAMQ